MKLRSRVEVRIDSGLPNDNWILREQLLTIFGEETKCICQTKKWFFRQLMGGSFWRRHKLRDRIATTKMQVIPADFEAIENILFKLVLN